MARGVAIHNMTLRMVASARSRSRRLAVRLGLGLVLIASLLLGAVAVTGSPDARSDGTSRNGAQLASAAPTTLPPLLPASRRGVFYVDARTGDDRADGRSKATAWKTVQKAVATLRPGQKVLVRAGVYRENVLIQRSGTPAAPITVVAHPGERPVLRPASPDGTGNAYPVRITGSYIRLRGFVIEGGTGTSDANVYFFAGAHHVELSYNEIRFGQDQGIFADDSTAGLHLLGNRIHDNGWGHVRGQHQSHGIYIEGRDHLIANNVIYNHPEGFGLHIWPTNRNTIVVGNTVVRSGKSGIVVGESGTSNITIRNNILAHNARFGVEPNGCPEAVVIDHNVLFGNGKGEVRGGCGGLSTGRNFGANPRFLSLDGLDFRLRPGSPAIGRGDPAFSLQTDALGLRRPAGRTPDIDRKSVV